MCLALSHIIKIIWAILECSHSLFYVGKPNGEEAFSSKFQLKMALWLPLMLDPLRGGFFPRAKSLVIPDHGVV